jgi:hypothetical protein
MNMSIETVLRAVAESLQQQIYQGIDDEYTRSIARFAGILVGMSANWIDSAVERRVAENAALRALFADAASVVSEAALAQRLTQAAASHDPGLKISQLEIENGRLRKLLVQLHTAVELQATAAARQLDQRIWRLLSDMERARQPQRG